MTLATSTSKVSYYGNGSTTSFTVPFYFLAASHIKVIIRNSSGIETTKTLTTDYSVTVNAPSGGTVVMNTAPSSGEIIVILRNVPFTQEIDYIANDSFPANTHEMALDKLTMEVQQLNELSDRSLSLSPSVSGVSTFLPIPSSNKFIAWNSDATELQNVDSSVLASIVAFGTAKADIFSGNGSTKIFTLTANPAAINNLDVSIAGVTQKPTIDYTWVSGTTLTFVTAPPSGTNNILVRYLQALPQGYTDSAASSFTLAGTGTQVRNVADCLSDFVSVMNFIPMGIDTANTDCTAYIQAAINSGYRAIYFPEGEYLVTSTLVVTSGIRLIGAGRRITIIKSSSPSADVLWFKRSDGTPTISSYLYDASITGISIKATDANTSASGIALKLTSVTGFLLNDVSVHGYLRGISVEGGQLNAFSNFYLTASGYTGSTIANKGLLHFSGVTCTDGSYQTPFTCEFNNFHMGGQYIAYSCIYIEAGDQLNFNNAYFGLNAQNNVTFLEATNFYIACTYFNGIYFEGHTGSSYTPRHIEIPDNVNEQFEASFENCVFNAAQEGVVIGTGLGSVRFDGCTFEWISGVGFVALDTSGGSLSLTGNTFYNCGTTAASNAIRINNASDVVIANNRISGATGAGGGAINLKGTIANAAVTGNVISNCTMDIDKSLATFTGKYIQSGNASSTTNPASMSANFGNVAVADVNQLDWYEESSANPTLQFGGAAVGMTGTFTARYSRVGNRCFFNIYILLTAKGTSTGAALIGNLPYTSENSVPFACDVRISSMTAGVLDQSVYAVVLNNTKQIRIDKGLTTGSVQQLTDADFTATSLIQVSGSYVCA